MIAKRVYYSGRVQGVGFRFATRQIAMGYEVVGRVRNIADGRVELYVMGDFDEVDEFLAFILKESNLAHHILEHEEEEIPLAEMEGVKGFSIVG